MGIRGWNENHKHEECQKYKGNERLRICVQPQSPGILGARSCGSAPGAAGMARGGSLKNKIAAKTHVFSPCDPYFRPRMRELSESAVGGIPRYWLSRPLPNSSGPTTPGQCRMGNPNITEEIVPEES